MYVSFMEVYIIFIFFIVSERVPTRKVQGPGRGDRIVQKGLALDLLGVGCFLLFNSLRVGWGGEGLPN